MVELVFDQWQMGVADRPSVFEALLRAALVDTSGVVRSVRPRSMILLDARPHGTRRAASDTEREVAPVEADAAPGAAAVEPQTAPAEAAVEPGTAPAEAAVEPAAEPMAAVGPMAVAEQEQESVVDQVAVGAGTLEPETAVFAGLLEAGAGHLEVARAAHREQSRQAAVQARALAAFAAARPAAVLDRSDEEVGAAAAATRAARPGVLTEVSEWAVDEVMVALGLSARAASVLLAESITLVQRLPATVVALETGLLSWAHARMLVQVLAPLADDTVRADVEAQLLAGAAGRTVGQLRASAQRSVLRADAAAAAQRMAAAVRARSVRAYPEEDGMGTLAATMPLPVLRACQDVLRQYARECAFPGDERTADQRTLDCLVDLLLRPDAAGRPPVQAHLTVVATADTLRGGDEPGEIDGQPVPAVLVREVAHALGLLPRPESHRARTASHGTGAEPTGIADAEPTGMAGAEPTGIADAEPTGMADAEPTGMADAEGTDAETTGAAPAAAALENLLSLRSTAGTALAALPTVAIADEISGALLALASPTEIGRAATCGRPGCRAGRIACTHPPSGPGLGPPPPTSGYRPSAPLRRFVRARDRRCRFPGCRARAARCDLDHNTAYPAGATSCDNLCCLCRHHHRLSHQAPGWTMHRLPDGGLEWTTPSGYRITTHPPRFGTDDPPPTLGRTPPDRPPPLTLRERVLGRPPTPEERANDPAPF